jgi:hypothetical protein
MDTNSMHSVVHNSDSTTTAPNEITDPLVLQLRGYDGARRLRARVALVKLGRPVVPLLLRLLTDHSQQVRWEACKALGSITLPSTAHQLVDALRDENMEVRWLAAEGLIGLKAYALQPLLKSLERHFGSDALRQGARHVLRALESENLLGEESIAVLDALRYFEPKSSVMPAARRALAVLSQSITQQQPSKISHIV